MARNPWTVRIGGRAELYQIWGEHRAIIGANQTVFYYVFIIIIIYSFTQT